MVKLDKSGELKDEMQKVLALGFKVGACLRLKSDSVGSTHRILRFLRAGEVELEKFDESATTTTKISDLVEKYVLSDTPSVISAGHVRL